MYKLDLEKAEEPEIKLPTSVGSQKKQESSKKISTSASLTTLKPVTVWIKQSVENSSRDGILDQLTCPLRNLYAGQEATELDMEQWTGSKLGKECVKPIYRHSAYLTYIRVHYVYSMLG